MRIDLKIGSTSVYAWASWQRKAAGISILHRNVDYTYFAAWWLTKAFFRDLRSGGHCEDCGRPYWQWWHHHDCIPF